MKIHYQDRFIDHKLFQMLLDNVKWQNAGAPRMECFMAKETLTYGYMTREGMRYYDSIPFLAEVSLMMQQLNNMFDADYNVCFLNYYENEKQHLGWHADDSPEMDHDHPIAVISFGEPRYIYVKQKDYRGVIPAEDQILLGNGSLFVMPACYQRDHLHKIPKGDHPMGGRISLTFRKFKPA